ncbi:Protein translocase subunit SecE [uncultured archaeon]|nr:Protein translocase subunit SecE [uncultured archaeon]
MFNLSSYIRECLRVLNVASRPRRREFEQIVKITGLGIVLVGLIGAVLSFLLNLV